MSPRVRPVRGPDESVETKNGGTTMLKKVVYVSLPVSDQDKALDYYTNVIGLEKRGDYPTPDGPRFLTVGVEGQDFAFVLWPGTPARVEDGSALPGTGAARSSGPRLPRLSRSSHHRPRELERDAASAERNQPGVGRAVHSPLPRRAPVLTLSSPRRRPEGSINGSIPHRTLEIVQVPAKEKAPVCGAFAEPSDGLEPSTPSLPCAPVGNRSQPTATVFAYLSFFAGVSFATGCHGLRPLGSIKAP
jgi:catechol 2,3-dioxygenase-like lactoylglutathione lyase family enzyme